MKIATIVSIVLLVLWIGLTMAMMWTDSVGADMYIKLTITMGILMVASIVIAIALREYGSEKKLKDHNYLD